MDSSTKSVRLARNMAVCYKRDYRWYYVESLTAPRPRQVAVHELNNTGLLDMQRKQFYVNVADLFVVVRDRPHPVHIASTASRPRPNKRVTHNKLYNYRKDVANGLLWRRFARDVAASQVHALLLDAPPRGHTDNQDPNSSAFLINKKGVPAANIVVANPDGNITTRLTEMGCVAHAVTFHEFVLHERPSVPFNYIYLDACGAYETQLRDGVRCMLESHDRWIANEAVLALVVCKRNAKGVVDTIRRDIDKWTLAFGYGRALVYPVDDPRHPLMHSVTFHLKRL
jgi:hypothetical protein